MNITIQKGERQIGPYTVFEVNRRLRDGELKPDFMAWQEGTKDWVPLKTIQGVGESPNAPAAKPKSKKFTRWLMVGVAVLVLLDIGIRLNSNSGFTPKQIHDDPKAESISNKPAPLSSPSVASKPKGPLVSMRGRIVRVLEEGVMVRCAGSYQVNNSDQTDGFKMNGTDELCYLSGDPRQREFTDDQFVGVICQKVGTARYGTQTLSWYEYVRNASNQVR